MKRLTALAPYVGPILFVAGLAYLVRKIAMWAPWPGGTDLDLYRIAAQSILDGGTPYSAEYSGDPYAYPPLVAILVTPLEALHVPQAYYLWVALSVASMMYGLALMLRGDFGARLSWFWIIAIGGVVMLGRIGALDLYHGQINLLLFALFMVGLDAWRRGATKLLAVSWAVMMVCKPFLGIVVLFLASRRAWRDMAWTLAVAAGVFLASFLIFAPHVAATFEDWVAVNGYYSTLPEVARPSNQTFYGILNRLFTETPFSKPWIDAPVLIPAGMTMLGALVLGALWLGLRAPAQSEGQTEAGARLAVQASLPFAAFFVLGPYSEASHSFVLLPALAGSATLAWAGGRSHAMWNWALVGWVLTFAIFLVPANFAQINPYSWGVLSGPSILWSARGGVLTLFAVLATVAALRADARERQN